MKATLTLNPTPGPLPTCGRHTCHSHAQNVFVGALEERRTHLVRRSASGEKVSVVIAMNRQVKDVGVVVKGLLGAVAVVNVLRAGSTRDILTSVSTLVDRHMTGQTSRSQRCGESRH